MKMTRASLQSKLDGLISMHAEVRAAVMKITRVSLQSKLDEVLLFFHTYSLMKITRVSLQSKLDELLLFFHTHSSMKITVSRQFVYGHFVYDTSSTDISSTDFSSTGHFVYWTIGLQTFGLHESRHLVYEWYTNGILHSIRKMN